MKAVIFDLDGTLLDRESSIYHFALNQYARFYPYVEHIGQEQFVSRFIELDNKGLVWKDRVYQQLITEYQITGLTSEQLLNDYIEYFCKSCVPFDYLYQMLKELLAMNVKLGMITNGKEKLQQSSVNALGLGDYFSKVFISEKEGVKKPNPIIFRRALQSLQVEPFEAFYVGDHPKNDIQAAQSVGMKTIWKKVEGEKCENANHVVDSLSEIPSIVRAYEYSS
ncbi:HAD family hydrolase [Gracilibacillus sp. S3-1-1]|uniref:HAD family hydrolase n=1 Tax=Gracilibacillus pellucidus TaxID=3095368 RepID=A0ACC6M6S1_9BACI|nr:HAD family hydrolase [Gracilibacillus sp. S3-1-1]MDX8046591.1 HAD family hydrolase [Gracilibacillus sp. S3-1-1]